MPLIAPQGYIHPKMVYSKAKVSSSASHYNVCLTHQSSQILLKSIGCCHKNTILVPAKILFVLHSGQHSVHCTSGQLSCVGVPFPFFSRPDHPNGAASVENQDIAHAPNSHLPGIHPLFGHSVQCSNAPMCPMLQCKQTNAHVRHMCSTSVAHM